MDEEESEEKKGDDNPKPNGKKRKPGAKKRSLKESRADDINLENNEKQKNSKASLRNKKQKTEAFQDFREYLLPLIPFIGFAFMKSEYFMNEVLSLNILEKEQIGAISKYRKSSFEMASLEPRENSYFLKGLKHARNVIVFDTFSWKPPEKEKVFRVLYKGKSTFVEMETPSRSALVFCEGVNYRI